MGAFTLKELEKIKEYSGDVVNASIRWASPMSKKGFRFRDGSRPIKRMIDGAFEEHAISSSICRKAADMIGRLTWPATQYCITTTNKSEL